MKTAKRQLILASLVLALGAAVYLNWTIADGMPLRTVGETSPAEDDTLQTRLVNAGLTEAADASSIPEEAEPAAAVEAAQNFSEARLARQKSRDAAMEMLEDVLEDVDADSEAKQTAVSQAAGIAQNILRETNIENLIKAKGCDDCMVYLEEAQCTAVVSRAFTEGEGLVILRDIILSQTGLSADAVRIVPTGA